MAVEKKIPMRQCLGCREMKPKKELVRVVRSPEGSVLIDLKGKAPGRGAYICRNAECLKRAVRSKGFDHAFSVKLSEDVLETLQLALEGQP